MEQHLLGLRPVGPLSWGDVFGFWRESEGSSPQWLAVARERGFETWEEWRRSYIPYFRMEERRWTLYRVLDPCVTVPRFRGGPFQGWIERTYGAAGPTPTFKTIAGLLSGEDEGYAQRMSHRFPPATTVLGVLTDDGVVIAEGMHRCSAIAMAAARGLCLQTDFRIALGSRLRGGVPVIPKIFKSVAPV